LVLLFMPVTTQLKSQAVTGKAGTLIVATGMWGRDEQETLLRPAPNAMARSRQNCRDVDHAM
jgi:hypothetical protein